MTFFLRYLVLQSLLLIGILAAWFAGVALVPFQGMSAPLCAVMVAVIIGALIEILFRRWDSARWIAKHLLRLGLLGTVIGLLLTFHAIKGGSATDPQAVWAMIARALDGMFLAFLVTLFGIGGNIWVKINLRYLGGDYE